MQYPASLSFKTPKSNSRLWAFLTILGIKPFLLIPHFIALYLLGILAIIFGILGIIATILTGEFPKSLQDFIVSVQRWGWRVNAYLFCLTDKYPPFCMN
jgi:hypothetical protein